MLLSILQCTGQRRTRKTCLTQSVNSSMVQKPCFSLKFLTNASKPGDSSYSPYCHPFSGSFYLQLSEEMKAFLQPLGAGNVSLS